MENFGPGSQWLSCTGLIKIEALKNEPVEIILVESNWQIWGVIRDWCQQNWLRMHSADTVCQTSASVL